MNEDLRRDIRQAEARSQYDTQCKRVLAHKVILAWIVRYTMSEFSSLSLEEIQDCIENPEISTVEVEPDIHRREKRSEKITGLTTESTLPGEGRITYDIYFSLSLPGKNECRRIYVNVEAQKKYNPGYQILSRGVYYTSRMISSQRGTEFSDSDYDKLKKVCSIWLCLNAPAEIGNAISEFSLTKHDVLPGIPDVRSAYDKISIILVALNEKKDSLNELTGMLNVLFSMTMPAETKLNILEQRYHMDLAPDLKGEVNVMCNLGDLAIDLGYEKGRAQGLKQGLEQGLEQGLQEGIEQGVRSGQDDLILSMLRNHISPEDISHMTNLPLERIQRAAKAGI
ncbi:MAG: hypothetical protein LUF00_10225 [Lachnospiraceae bacterium]|nr:hypothetical protein [Lachnospiraceae bacterium]